MPLDQTTFDYDDPILRTAAFLEAHPQKYDFNNVCIPECGSRGCLLGWIGFFAQVESGRSIQAACRAIGFYDSWDFYKAMDEAAGTKCWFMDVDAAVRGLRVLADPHRRAELAQEAVG